MSITFHTWSDGGGTYAAVVHTLDAEDASITLFSDDAETHAAQRVIATPAQIAWIKAEYALTDNYAAAFYSDVIEGTGTIADLRGDPYLVVTDGKLYAIVM